MGSAEDLVPIFVFSMRWKIIHHIFTIKEPTAISKVVVILLDRWWKYIITLFNVILQLFPLNFDSQYVNMNMKDQQSMVENNSENVIFSAKLFDITESFIPTE